MSSYIRPIVAEQTFRDDPGHIIEYGERWGHGSPPEDSYSVESNLERFAPLYTVADALIAHLRAEHNVDVSEDPAHAADLLRDRDDVIRAVRLTPSNGDAALLTFVFTSFPSVIVHAGVLH